jgi:hypothetical protein
MKPYKKKSPESYVRFLKIFERELRNYDEAFDNEFYQLNYTLTRVSHTNMMKIKVVLSVYRNVIWRKLSERGINLKELLESYCFYFNVDEVVVVRPFAIPMGTIRNSSNLSEMSSPIEQRVSFEMFLRESEWRLI